MTKAVSPVNWIERHERLLKFLMFLGWIEWPGSLIMAVIIKAVRTKLTWSRAFYYGRLLTSLLVIVIGVVASFAGN